MATSTTTAIELGSLAANSSAGVTTQRDGPHPSTAATPLETSDEDPILAASRLADSSVPDGGYGWVVVFGCAIVTWWFVGTSYSWGVMQGALVKQGLSSPATLSFVGSLSAALISALAIVNGRVVRRLGARKTALLGVMLLGFSELMSSFAVTNVAGLFVTSGVVLGLGMR
jgi:hypothetical protein